MDFFSPITALAIDFLLNPGPILPSLDDVTALFTAAPAVERHAPAPMPSIESLLALPSGFRAPGYEALTFSHKSIAGN